MTKWIVIAVPRSADIIWSQEFQSEKAAELVATYLRGGQFDVVVVMDTREQP
jgi:hypothetical protein